MHGGSWHIFEDVGEGGKMVLYFVKMAIPETMMVL